MAIGEIHYADPKARRRAALCVMGITIIGMPVLWIIDASREHWGTWLAENIEQVQEHAWIVVPFTLVMMWPLIAFAFSTWELGRRAIRTGRFPPLGRSTLRDVRVLKGLRAVQRGRSLQFLGILLAALCLGVPLMIRAIVLSL